MEQEKSETTDRERRMVSKLIIFFLHSTITHVNFSDSRRNLILFNVFYADCEKAYKFYALLLSRCCFSGYCSVTLKSRMVSRNAQTRANMYRSWKLRWTARACHGNSHQRTRVSEFCIQRKVLENSKSVRPLQIENSYLRKRNRQLKERVKNVNTFSDLIQQSIFMERIRNHYKYYFIWLF